MPSASGQAEVDDEGVVGEVLEALDGVGGVGRLGDLEPVGAQRLGDELSEIGFIVDDEDGGLGGAGHGMRTCLCTVTNPQPEPSCHARCDTATAGMMDGAPDREREVSDEKLATNIDVRIAKCQAITQTFQN